jgi:hypothetical protein
VESVSSAPIKEGKIKKKRGSMGLWNVKSLYT